MREDGPDGGPPLEGMGFEKFLPPDGPVGGLRRAEGPRGGDLAGGGERRSAAGCRGASRMVTSRSLRGESLIGASRSRIGTSRPGALDELFLGDMAGESGRDLSSRARMLDGRGEDLRDTG